MDFALTEEQRLVIEAFRSFAEREVAPQAEELDRHPRFPAELFRRAGEMGLFSMRYPAPEGGGADALSFCLAVEEIAAASLAVAACCTMQSLMGTCFLHRFAPEAVRSRLLPAAFRGERIGTICMTEPDAGSDLASIATRAEPGGGAWLLTGQKTWITSAPVADFFTVFARTGPDELSVFLAEKGAEGLAVGRSIEKAGVRASLTSEVAFQRTPALCLLGEKGKGMEYLREILSEIRVVTAALSVGIARASLAAALGYAKERRQFGQPIGRFQAVQSRLAEMSTDLEAARLLTYRAAWLVSRKAPCEREAAAAKLLASEAANRIADGAARIFGSYGFAVEYPVERYLRDARFLLLGGGTSEILRAGIGRMLVR